MATTLPVRMLKVRTWTMSGSLSLTVVMRMVQKHVSEVGETWCSGDIAKFRFLADVFHECNEDLDGLLTYRCS
jgi:hypothetical protein